MQYLEAANHWDGREGQVPRFVILHGTAGQLTALEIAQMFAKEEQNPATGSSANVIIGVAGDMAMSVQYGDAAWANGALTAGHDTFWDTACDVVNGVPNINPNLISIAIEHCKPSADNSDALTPAQQAASFSLVESICNQFGIPKRPADANGGIADHSSLDPVNRARCPGPYPHAELYAYLNRTTSTDTGEDMPLSITSDFAKMFFKQSGVGQWTCTSKKTTINGAILVYYCTTQGALGLPENNEQYNIKGVVWQLYERGIMIYDPQDLLKQTPPNAHNHTYFCMISSALGQQVLNAPVQAALAKANAATATAQASLVTANSKILDLGKQLAELQAAVPVNTAQLTTQLANASAAITAAQALIKK